MMVTSMVNSTRCAFRMNLWWGRGRKGKRRVGREEGRGREKGGEKDGERGGGRKKERERKGEKEGNAMHSAKCRQIDLLWMKTRSFNGVVQEG
ncbi:hypothetical protein [Achromobacter marplatensis]|uniref:hypothetical protein n=1 Tax=Achromobacter marplatensis TaxID=470868 RepID=UPI003C71B089